MLFWPIVFDAGPTLCRFGRALCVCCVGQNCTVNAQSVHVINALCKASLGDESILDGMSVKLNLIAVLINLLPCV